MTKIQNISIGFLMLIALVLIVVGHIENTTIVYSIGWAGFVIGFVTLLYKSSNIKKGENEYITGGTCDDIKKYLQNTNNIDAEWCNFEKTDSDKTYLTKTANRKFHPNSNVKCSEEATKAFQNVNNKCESIIEGNLFDKFSKWWNTPSTPSQSSTPQSSSAWSTPQSSSSWSTPKNYSNMSDYDLRQEANSGNSNAYKEMADRRFRDSPINVKSDPDARPELDFCTIM